MITENIHESRQTKEREISDAVRAYLTELSLDLGAACASMDFAPLAHRQLPVAVDLLRDALTDLEQARKERDQLRSELCWLRGRLS